jgi:hypothetical protein
MLKETSNVNTIKTPFHKLHWDSNLIKGLTVVVVFGVVGSALLLSSHAATPVSSVEPESGTVSGPASVVTDTTASGGRAVRFTQSSGGTSAWPDATNTGYAPTGVTLHTCSTTVTAGNTYDSCQFNGNLNITGVCKAGITITRSLIKGQVDVRGPNGYEYTPGNLGPNANCDETGVVMSDTTIDCGCMSQGVSDSPAALVGLNFTLLRVNIFNSAHGVAPDEHARIQDSYIHGLGGNTEAHKDGIFISDGDHMVIKHNQIECNDGPIAGCTSALGILSDFSDTTFLTMDNNLLNTNGSYCFYGSGGPQKPFHTYNSSFINNHFGRKYYSNCGFYGPVTYWDATATGNVWSGNVWDDTGQVVPPAY